MKKIAMRFRWWAVATIAALAVGMFLAGSLGANDHASVPAAPAAKVAPTPFYTVPAPSAGAPTLTVAPLPPEAFNPGGSNQGG